jgi:antitoxin component of MazEF toxin-antitoxin module
MMKRKVVLVTLLLALCVLATACEDIAGLLYMTAKPLLSIQNSSDVNVRVMASLNKGGSQYVTIAPGERAGVELGQSDRFTVVVIRDQQWLETAKGTRKVLAELLAQPDKMTAEQIRDVVQRINNIQAQIDKYDASKSGGGSCSGALPNDSMVARATVSKGSDGQLAASCQ